MLSPETVDRVIAAVAKEMGVSREMILAPSRSSANVARARQMAVFILWKAAGEPSWSALGRVFGRDRTTIRHAVKTILSAPADSTLWRLVDECSTPAL
ncbi:DnaA [Pseudanabaena phage Pam3]|nr:DnaA [Pseudanabaena phage Pam3]